MNAKQAGRSFHQFVNCLPLLLAGLSLFVVTPARATPYENFGVKLGALHHENPGYEDALNFGLTVGGRIIDGEHYSIGLQVEMTTSIIEGNTNSFRENWEMDSHALYAGIRIGQTHFFKLKAGVIRWQVRYGTAPDVNDTGFSWGISYGYPLSTGRKIELEYTVMSDKPDFGITYINLGYLF